MVKLELFEDQFPHMAAAMETAKSVQPGNELQEQAAADIARLAFDMEVRRVFPETLAVEGESFHILAKSSLMAVTTFSILVSRELRPEYQSQNVSDINLEYDMNMTNILDEQELAENIGEYEDLGAYPHFTECVRHFESEFGEYIIQLRQEATTLPEDGNDIPSWAAGCEEIYAANPHIVIPLFLKRRGAPIVITDSEEWVTVTVDPEIREAYEQLWNSAFNGVARRLANDIAHGSIDRLEAFPELAQPSIMEIPSGNRQFLWAFQQGILQRAYVTSTIVKYLARGVDSSNLGSATPDAPLAEGLIEKGVLPLPLETVLGMGEAEAAAILQEHPELIEKLKLDPESLPKVDTDRLTYQTGWFELYWQPVKAKIDVANQRRAETAEKTDNSAEPSDTSS